MKKSLALLLAFLPVFLFGQESISRYTVNFPSGGFRVNPISMEPILDELKLKLDGGNDVRIVLKGHTDAEGSDKLNSKLSEKRAMAVKDEFIKLSIMPEKIEVQAFGSELPLAPNSTEAGRAKNRRVEIEISIIPFQKE